MEFWCGPIMVLERIANPSLGESRVLSSSLSRTAKLVCTGDRAANVADCKSVKSWVRVPPCAPVYIVSLNKTLGS